MPITITEFTDTICTWCWGAEPVLAAVQERYGDAVEIRYVTGGLVEDIRAFRDPGLGIGGDPEASNRAIAAHWAEASARHGMPVQPEGFAYFSADQTSSYPANIAYHAAKIASPELADRYLRRLREASEAEARQTGRTDVQVELAAEVGVDVAAFIAALTDGRARQAFTDDLATTAAYGVRGFPAFLISKDDEKGYLLPSYQPLAAFEQVIGLLDPSLRPTIPDASDDALVKVISRRGRMAPAEIAEIFGLSREDAVARLESLVTRGLVWRDAAGTGSFYGPAIAGCGPDGVCRIENAPDATAKSS